MLNGSKDSLPWKCVTFCYSVTCMTISKKNRSLLATNGFLFALTIGADGDARKCAGYACLPFPSPGSIISTFCSWQYYSWKLAALIDKLYSMISRFIQYNSFDFITITLIRPMPFEVISNPIGSIGILISYLHMRIIRSFYLYKVFFYWSDYHTINRICCYTPHTLIPIRESNMIPK